MNALQGPFGTPEEACRSFTAKDDVEILCARWIEALSAGADSECQLSGKTDGMSLRVVTIGTGYGQIVARTDRGYFVSPSAYRCYDRVNTRFKPIEWISQMIGAPLALIRSIRESSNGAAVSGITICGRLGDGAPACTIDLPIAWGESFDADEEKGIEYPPKWRWQINLRIDNKAQMSGTIQKGAAELRKQLWRKSDFELGRLCPRGRCEPPASLIGHRIITHASDSKTR